MDPSSTEAEAKYAKIIPLLLSQDEAQVSADSKKDASGEDGRNKYLGSFAHGVDQLTRKYALVDGFGRRRSDWVGLLAEVAGSYVAQFPQPRKTEASPVLGQMCSRSITQSFETTETQVTNMLAQRFDGESAPIN